MSDLAHRLSHNIPSLSIVFGHVSEYKTFTLHWTWYEAQIYKFGRDPTWRKTLIIPGFSHVRHSCCLNILFNSSALLSVIRCPPFLIAELHFTKLKGSILSLVPWIWKMFLFCVRFVQRTTLSIAHFKNVGSVSKRICFKSCLSKVEVDPKNQFVIKLDFFKNRVGKSLWSPNCPAKR